MRKVVLLFLSVALFSGTFATSISEVKPVLNANKIMLPVGKTGQKISLMELSKISLKDFEKLKNTKMNFFDRLAFKAGQKKLRKNINEDGTLKKRFEKGLKRMMAGETGFHIGGFALGFFVGLIGVLIAYLINDDFKKNRVKWAWIGFGAFLLIYIVLLIIILDAFGDALDDY